MRMRMNVETVVNVVAGDPDNSFPDTLKVVLEQMQSMVEEERNHAVDEYGESDDVVASYEKVANYLDNAIRAIL